MKKNLITPHIAIIAIVIVVVAGFPKPDASEKTSLLMENIEALSSPEDGGIDVADCYFHGNSPEMKCVKECNNNTTTDRIYPCPSDERYMQTNARGTCYK